MLEILLNNRQLPKFTPYQYFILYSIQLLYCVYVYHSYPPKAYMTTNLDQSDIILVVLVETTCFPSVGHTKQRISLNNHLISFSSPIKQQSQFCACGKLLDRTNFRRKIIQQIRTAVSQVEKLGRIEINLQFNSMLHIINTID